MTNMLPTSSNTRPDCGACKNAYDWVDGIGYIFGSSDGALFCRYCGKRNQIIPEVTSLSVKLLKFGLFILMFVLVLGGIAMIMGAALGDAPIISDRQAYEATINYQTKSQIYESGGVSILVLIGTFFIALWPAYFLTKWIVNFMAWLKFWWRHERA